MKEFKVLMVCLGNICRSPIAEGLLQQKVNEHNLNVQVDSCGTGGWHAGELPDPRSIQKMDEHGIDIRNQKSRKIQDSDFDEFDVIYCMDKSNLSDVKTIAKANEHKV
ncbi:MAG: low molecular weight protein-tyrosine-phosphatase, partial [Flavobacteriales bacterium]